MTRKSPLKPLIESVQTHDLLDFLLLAVGYRSPVARTLIIAFYAVKHFLLNF